MDECDQAQDSAEEVAIKEHVGDSQILPVLREHEALPLSREAVES